MKKFLLKISLFILCMLILFIPTAIPIVFSRELTLTQEEIGAMFISREIDIASFEIKGTQMYNYLRGCQYAVAENAEVVAFGTSRSMHFNSYIFDEPEKFANLSITINGTNYIENYTNILKSIIDIKKPRVVIIDLNQWNFAQEHTVLQAPIDEDYNWFNYQTEKMSVMLKRYFTMFFQGDVDIIDSVTGYSDNKLGLNAGSYNTGMMLQGPTYYGEKTESFYEDYDKFNSTDNMHHDITNFYDLTASESDTVNAQMINNVSDFLSFAKSENIHVIAILPPFTSQANNIIQENEDMQYLLKLYDQLKPIFDEYNFEIYDYTDVSILGINDNDFFDFFHINEVAAGKMILDIVKQDSVLAQYITPQNLEEKIDNAYSQIEFEPLIFEIEGK